MPASSSPRPSDTPGRLTLARDYIVRSFQVAGVMLRFVWRAVRRKVSGQPLDGPMLVREMFEHLGGGFVKFGQILSLQIDTLPREYCDALLSLLDRVPESPRESVEQVFREEFGSLPEDLYAEFGYQPVASASIGQVHRARTKDGQAVAVKVQRPGVRRKLERDILLMRSFVAMVFFFRIRSMYFMRDPVRELHSWTGDELDYRREAGYCQLLGDNAVNTPTERVPRIHWELTTTRVLTMEFLEGPSVSTYLRMVESNDEPRLAELRKNGFDPGVFVGNVISNFLSDAFRFGVFHADLHPANLLILPNNVVGYVDFGIVAVLTTEARRKQIELTLAYSSGDPQAIYEGFMNICMIEPDVDLRAIQRRIEAMTEQWYDEPAVAGKVRFRVTVTKAMMDLLTVCRDYGVLVDREMIKYIRSTILTDGLVSRLARDFDLARTLRLVVEDFLEREARQKIFSSGGALAMLADLTMWMDAGPGAFLRALNLFERRQLRVRADLRIRADKDGPLRTRALTVAGIWAMSVLFLGLGGMPEWRRAPELAAVAAGFLGLWTLWMLRLVHKLTR